MAHFCVQLFCIGMCSVFWLFQLSCQYLPSDWLETLLSKPNHGEGIISIKPRLKAPCGLQGCNLRVDPLHFLAGCCTRQLNQAQSVILLYFFIVLFIRVPFYVLLIFVGMCSVFWLLWLSCH